jgi:PAS domain S-box-containing protein
MESGQMGRVGDRFRESALRRFALLLAMCLAAAVGASAAQAQERNKRVLLLYPYDNTLPATNLSGEAARKRLLERTGNKVEIYIDFLDLVRFPDDAHAQRTARFLAEKYARTPLDLVIVLNTESQRFATRYRNIFAPDVPIVFCCVTRALMDSAPLPPDVTGIVSEYDITKSVELARRLQPDARNIVYIGGASEVDRRWTETYRRQLAPFEASFNITYLVGLPHEELLRRVAQLPRDTIVLIGTVFVDGAGRQFVPVEVGADVSRVSSAPTYSPADPFLGRGIVGGHMATFEGAGTEVGDLAFEILGGADPRTISPRSTQALKYRVDARQLQRWGMAEGNLPEGTDVHFKEPTLWEQHRNVVIITVWVILLQAGLITTLLIQILRRRRVESSLKESEERWRSVFETSTVGIALADQNRKYLVTNGAFQSMLGYPADELRGLSRSDITIDDDRSDRAARRDFGEGRRPHHDMVKQYRRKDGTPIWVHEYVSMIPGQDDKGGLFLETAIDITDRKRAEQAMQVAQSELARVTRLTTMGEMTASIAHEVNQPLAAIVASSNAGLRWLTNATPNLEQAQASFRRIVKEGHRAAEVIATVRAMFKKDTYARTRVDLDQMVKDVLGLVQTDLQANGIAVESGLAGALPPVQADRVQLQQVILNLVMNAAEAMANVTDRPRVLRIRSEVRRPSDVLLTVEDTGPGIAAEDLGRVFEAFYTTKSSGMGMGLSICRSIVEAHGGRLSASRGHPHGAVLQVVLPIDSED